MCLRFASLRLCLTNKFQYNWQCKALLLSERERGLGRRKMNDKLSNSLLEFSKQALTLFGKKGKARVASKMHAKIQAHTNDSTKLLCIVTGRGASGRSIQRSKLTWQSVCIEHAYNSTTGKEVHKPLLQSSSYNNLLAHAHKFLIPWYNCKSGVLHSALWDMKPSAKELAVPG